MSEPREAPAVSSRRRRGRAFGAGRRAAAVLLAGALVAAGCGTRLSDEDRAIARGGAAAPATDGSAGPEAGVGASGAGAGAGSAATTGLPGDVGAASGSSAVGSTGDVTTGQAGASDGTGAAAAGGAGSGAGSGSTAAPVKEPIVLGSVGTLSGPSGEAWIDGSNALKLWVRDVNSRGGVDGHPIKLIVVDDQGDPSRQISAVKSIAEDQRGFAFVYMGWSNSESKALLDYLEQNKIPVVGTTLTSRANLTHPTVFPQGTANVELQEATLRGAVRLLPSVKRYGQLTCLEAPTCSEAAELWWRLAPQLGLDPRARGEVSIGQPDFTAECLSMQREQVQMLAIAVDPNSLRRLAASCARQGYRPQYVVPSAVINASQNGDENFENSVGITSTVPWQVTTGSGPAGFYAARARFAPRLEVNLSTTVAWAAGRLFELGASSGLGSPPSRQRLMDRLYQVRKETLGGLSPPLTFVRGRSKGPRCWFAMQFTDGAWRPAAGGRHVC